MTAIRPPKPTAWQAATVVSIREETPRVKTIRFAVPNWPGHLAGPTRRRASDGRGWLPRANAATRSPRRPRRPAWSSPSSAWTTARSRRSSPSQLQPGDTIELRGPIGGYFVWSAAEARNPLLLVGGGSGVVPLMCMLRHRRLSGSPVPAALLYSARTREDVIYQKELSEIARGDPRFTLRITLTRDSAPRLVRQPSGGSTSERYRRNWNDSAEWLTASFAAPADSWRRRPLC